MRVKFDEPPYDQNSIQAAWNEGQCAAVQNWFAENLISPGDCIVLGDEAFEIVAVRVVCGGNPVYEAGAVPPGNPNHTNDYDPVDVQVQLWLEEIEPDQCP